MSFPRVKRADETDRWALSLIISAAVVSAAFLLLGAAVWVSQEGLISTSQLVTESRTSVSWLDEALNDLAESRDDHACSVDKDPQACDGIQSDRRDFRRMMNMLSAQSDQGGLQSERLRLIQENLNRALPRSTQSADQEALAIINDATHSLRNYQQFQLNRLLDKFRLAGLDAQRTMIALLGLGAILLMAGQVVLWNGIRSQRKGQRQLEELNSNLSLARREALALSEAKGRFLADMSHEIRTPLNGIVGMASMLSLADASPEDAEILRTIRASSDVLLRVVDDVLDLSKIDSNRVELLAQPLELNTLLRDVSSLYQGMADANRNRLIIDIPQTDKWVLGDAVRLKQVFGNLVSNAVKFCREGEVHVSISSTQDDVHEIRVSDSGVGIAPDRLENIFDEFVQAQISVSQEHPGTGLGLAIARKLIRRMGGEISVKSELGVGSEFKVAVPLAACAAPQAPSSAQTYDLAGLRVLLAEDNNVNILVASAMLERAGCVVDVARDGLRATEMAIEGSYDVILMDLRMPLRPGTEAAHAILEKVQGTPNPPKIVAMTANASAEDREACLSAGMVGFLAKPFTFDLLVETLGSVAPNRTSPRH